MKQQWLAYCQKFLTISPREQYLIIGTGLIGVIFITFSFFIDDNRVKISKYKKQIAQTTQANRTSKTSIEMLENALTQDPNEALRAEVAQYKQRLAKVDVNLLKLTSDLIDPVQMRHALLKLLKIQKGISLQSFSVMPAQTIALEDGNSQPEEPVTNEKSSLEGIEAASLTLYRHGIKIKLSGDYFQLRNYLKQVENLPWKFFWKEFNYQLEEYPTSVLEIEMYSLSTNKEFIGV